MPSNNDMPKWDVALAALAKDTFQKKAAPLVLDDFRHLASEHAIRFDDIMESMFQLAINGEWRYTDSSGSERVLDQATLDSLYVKRRLSEEDLSAFDGGWQPV
ncbi:MAG: hypothetical protein BMS9Abin09_0418 [Gammaproteobacteria bacterium]|nr:MAG: hypothetical protein BMS9Abin09_0418 [Gammaproteobacteria bacterium]